MLRLARQVLQKQIGAAKSSSQTAQKAATNIAADKPHSLLKRLTYVAGGFSTCFAFWYANYLYTKSKFTQKQTSISKEENARRHFEKMEHIDIGGHEFSLINCKDLKGPRITGEDFKGKWHLLYFGFTHCPDICPSELEKMTDVLTILDEDITDHENKYSQIVPVFITIDPDRDSPQNILKYLKDYHPRYLALTGSENDILNAAKGLRVYYTKGPVDADGDYILDHTLITYLISPEGKLFDYYGTTKYKPSQLVKMIKEKIDFYHLYH